MKNISIFIRNYYRIEYTNFKYLFDKYSENKRISHREKSFEFDCILLYVSGEEAIFFAPPAGAAPGAGPRA